MSDGRRGNGSKNRRQFLRDVAAAAAGAGAVAALERIKNPISVARKIMERTEHVMLVGAGANAFARKVGFVEEELMTPAKRQKWLAAKASFWRTPAVERHDTVACIGRD